MHASASAAPALLLYRQRSRARENRVRPGRRSSSSCGAVAAGPTRQRVKAGPLPGVFAPLSKRQGVAASRAASDKRRAGVRAISSTRPATVASAPDRKPSSIAHSMSCSRFAVAMISPDRSKPRALRPGPYSVPSSCASRCGQHSRIGGRRTIVVKCRRSRRRSRKARAAM